VTLLSLQEKTSPVIFPKKRKKKKKNLFLELTTEVQSENVELQEKIEKKTLTS